MDEGSIMVGPKYPGIQDSGYEYNPPSTRGQLPKVEVISAPVFVEDGANKYSVVPEKTHGELLHPLPLHGPGVEAKNAYCPQEEKQPGQLVLAGPVFSGIDDSSKYNIAPMKSPLDGTRLMTAPIFPGIKASNKYGPVEPELAPKEKIKMGKPFVAPNYPGVECKNTYNLDKIENGMPDPFRMDEGSIMVGPKYPGIQDSGYEY